MPKQGSCNMDIDKLKSLYESLKTKPDIQVGVFANKSPRKMGSLSNADLAAIHEFGAPSRHLPARSVLRTPIADHAQEIMGSVKGKADAIIEKGGAMKLWKLIGIAAEKVIIQAFATGGFGKWAPLKYSTLLGKLKGSLSTRKKKIAKIFAGEIGMGILIRTGELRRSYGSRVKMKF